MKVRVRLFASYREVTGQREMGVELPAEATVGELLEQLVAQYPALEQVARVSRCVINQEYVASATPLHEGDEVVFIPPVSGGDVFEVTAEPISAEPLIAEATDEAVGAVVTFLGVARRFSKGKRVRYLEYEAYKEMAEQKLVEIGAALRLKWPVERVAIRHRVGRLEIGETAIVIAVGAAHRGEAFEACRYAIDQIKKTVPVWKKEVWEDGEVWIGMEGG